MIRMNKEEGFTGLEAAIVLIAFVVVAAVFSYVVLGAGFFTTQKSQEVIYTSVDQASSSVEIMGDIYGFANATNPTEKGIEVIRFTVGLTSGGSPVDFSQTTMTFSAENSSNVEALKIAQTSPLNVDCTWTNQGQLDVGEWAVFRVNNNGTSIDDLLLENQEQFVIGVKPTHTISANERFNLEIRPSVGTAYAISRKAPARIQGITTLY